MIEKMRYHYLRTEGGHAVACVAVKSKCEGVLAVGISVRSKRETTWDKRKMREIAAGRCNVQFDRIIETGERKGEIRPGRTSKSVCPFSLLGIQTHPFADISVSQARIGNALKPLIDVNTMTLALAGHIYEADYWAAMQLSKRKENDDAAI